MIEKKFNEEEFTKEFAKLFCEDKPIIIFGAGEIGRRAVLRMEYLGIKKNICCIGDNSEDKMGSCLEEIPVFSKQKIKEKYPDARIVVAVGNETAAEQIKKELGELGFTEFISRQALLDRYEYDGQREKPMVLTNQKYILRQAVVCVTERCTLKCKNCSQLMPKFSDPRDIDTDTIINSVKIITDAVTYIQDLTLLGGEPLMNKDMPAICKAIGELKKQNKIKFISIISNGTIIPNIELLRVMKEYGINIMFSDYGALSVNMREAQLACREAGVKWQYAYVSDKNEEKLQHWRAVGNLEKQSFKKAEWESRFKNCNSVYNCNTLYNGRYFLCNFSAFLYGLRLIGPENNSFNLLDDTIEKKELCKRYRDFMLEERPNEGCYFCNFHGEVPAAEQV